MACTAGPKIVDDGLVLHLDAANLRSYTIWNKGWSGSFGNALNSFNGNLTTFSGGVGGNFTATYTFDKGFNVSETVRIYVTFGASISQVGATMNVILVDGIDITAKMKNAAVYSTGGWIDVTNEVGKVFNSIVLTGTSGSTNPGIAAIEINGVILTENLNTWYDLSGNGNHGTLINGPAYNNNNKGSIVFDGSDDYASIPYSNSINIGGLNISLIVTIESTSLADPLHGDGIISRYSGSNDGTYEILLIKGVDTNYTYFRMNNVGTYTPQIIPIELNKKFHISCVYDNGTMRNYINSIQEESIGLVKNINITQNSGLIKIGDRQSSNAKFGGKIYNVQVYNRALSAEEIAQNFEATRGRYGI